jgi:hypothetical protein
LYKSLQLAYNNAAINDTVQVQAVILEESPVLNRKIGITIKGGYDSLFSTTSGTTKIHGKLTIQSGTVIVNGITIR